jgi:hypothetical protein
MVQFPLIAAACILVAAGQGQAFTVFNTRLQQSRTRIISSLNSKNGEENHGDSSSSDSRRGFLSRVVATSRAAAAVGITQGTLFLLSPPAPAHAVGGLNKVNAKLQGYGLPPVVNVPDGFTPLCDIYGKGSNRFPLLVTFNHP